MAVIACMDANCSATPPGFPLLWKKKIPGVFQVDTIPGVFQVFQVFQVSGNPVHRVTLTVNRTARNVTGPTPSLASISTSVAVEVQWQINTAVAVPVTVTTIFHTHLS